MTVALSGDGGDENFAGYDFRYVPLAIEAEARRWMPRALMPAAGWLGRRWPRSPRLPKALRAGTLLDNLSRDPASAYYADLAFLKPGEARRLIGLSPNDDPAASPVYEAVTAPFRRCPSRDLLQRAEYADLKVYLPNDPLVKVDRMPSMAHALEVRCPLPRPGRNVVGVGVCEFPRDASRSDDRARASCALSQGDGCRRVCGIFLEARDSRAALGPVDRWSLPLDVSR